MVKYDYIEKKSIHSFQRLLVQSLAAPVKLFLGKVLNPKLLYAYQRMNVGQKNREKSARING